MDADIKFELNIALIPEDELADRLIATSQQCAAERPALVRLDTSLARLALPPHLTLYQAPIPLQNLSKLMKDLKTTASQLTAPLLQAADYAYNKEEASFEIGYNNTDLLQQWQESVIGVANPLRKGLLLERDPGGNEVEPLLQGEGLLSDNIRRTGYAEVGDPRTGGLFRPHVTLNWFKVGTKLDLNDPSLPDLPHLDGLFSALGVYMLGPQGTCPQRLAKFSCANYVHLD